ncbi:MAG: tetratricopeptide repeat protein, partial [Anaerolineae bacterium]|nr:tetratricopeptide repeat protein [Anaerolineae bacterium]
QENEMLHGFILEESGRKKEALAFYKSLVEKDSDDLVAAYRLSLLYFKDQKYKNAENILDDILEENPGMEEARILLANLYFDKGLYKEAISQLDHIARGSMVELEAAFLAAKCQFKLNRFRDAVIGFKTLSASRDLKPDELIMYATALKETNDFISAKLMLAKAKNQDPKDKAVKAQIRRLEQDLPPIARLEIDRPESDRQD